MRSSIIKEFQKFQATQGKRPRTVIGYQYLLGYLFDYLEARGIEDVKDIKKETLLAYQEYLYHEYKTKEGGRLSLPYQANLIGVLNPFFTFLVMTDKILYNPATGINKPRLPKRIPRNILTEKEIKILLTLPDLTTSEGYRDRVLLEMLYSTGIRASEARFLKVRDIDLNNRELFIQEAKGGKERVVPLTRSCNKFIEVYLVNQRNGLLSGRVSDRFFIGDMGKPFHKEKVSQIVRKYATEAKWNKVITTHSIRHTCATHLLKKGASIRLIQELLGHDSLDTTEKYTRVEIGDLKSALDRYHPRGGLS